MAVLVSKEHERRYQATGSVGISQSEREQADRLDAKLKKRLEKLANSLTTKNLMPQKKGKGTLLAYWELGNALRDVTQNKSDFPYEAELPLLWQNAKMYLPQELLYRDRGPYREHLWYCYRLGGYPKNLVQKMKWGEWVTIFDSPGINQEPRFDQWFEEKLTLQKKTVAREQIRMFAPCVNKLLCNIDIHALSKAELLNCYEATWQIALRWHAKKISEPDYTDKRENIQKRIEGGFTILDKVMEGTVSPDDFASEILGETKKL